MWTYFKHFLFSCFRGFVPLEAKNLKFFLTRKRVRPLTGFTLIELLVVSLIIILITGTVLFRQEGFSSSTVLRSLAYSVALSVRQAQVYGVSVRESAVGSNVFAPGYGVYFGDSALTDNTHYLIFADANGNGQYAVGEELPRFTVGNGRGTDYQISTICAHRTSGDECFTYDPSGAAFGGWLSVYFRRPNPDACFATSASPNVCAAGATPVYDYAYVQIKTVAGDLRTIKVSNTGQIAVCRLGDTAAAC